MQIAPCLHVGMLLPGHAAVWQEHDGQHTGCCMGSEQQVGDCSMPGEASTASYKMECIKRGLFTVKKIKESHRISICVHRDCRSATSLVQ